MTRPIGEKEMAKLRKISLSFADAVVIAVALYNGVALQTLVEDNPSAKKVGGERGDFPAVGQDSAGYGKA